MLIQWCIKGLTLPNDEAAEQIIDKRVGLLCNWWRRVGRITPQQRRQKLTPYNVDMHVNHFTAHDPVSGGEFCKSTPFISLSAGTVERDAAMKTNTIRTARETALWFGTQFGQQRYAYLFHCWVVVAPRRSVEIEGVAEEVRDLHTYRSYSAYQLEGEIAAKIQVPSNQILKCEKWDNQGVPRRVWTHPNPAFIPPETLSNIREVI